PADFVAVLDIGWEGTPQCLEIPGRVLTIKLRHIVPKSAFELAIRLWVTRRGMDKPDPQVPTEGLQQFPPKYRALVKDDAFGNHLPLPHGAAQSGNRDAWIDVVEE